MTWEKQKTSASKGEFFTKDLSFVTVAQLTTVILSPHIACLAGNHLAIITIIAIAIPAIKFSNGWVIEACTRLLIITIITIAITAMIFRIAGCLALHVLIINRVYRNLAPHTRKRKD